VAGETDTGTIDTGEFTPTAHVIADSITPFGHRLTTMEVTLHRFMLAEFNTHRAFSRNSASSRAIPVSKTLRRLVEFPGIPLSWPLNQRGMQGGPELGPADAAKAQQIWLGARDNAVQSAEKLLELGVHKSVVNRLLEPFMTTTIIVSATEWDNFFHQRATPPATVEALAQAEIRAAADAMQAAYTASEPTPVPQGNWHLPYITHEDISWLARESLAPVSAARCARVSYLTHAGKRDPQADLDLYQRLVTADPPHASPLEHVATPARWGEDPPGNFTGWRQLRHVAFPCNRKDSP
jgi:thymidylate synthase ThyX